MTAFDEASAAVLQSTADQIAIALSNAVQFQQTQSGLRRTQQLYGASVAISTAEDAAEILNEFITRAVPDADAVQLLLYGPRDEAGTYAYLEVAACWAPQNSDRLLPAGTRVPPEQLPPVPALASKPYIIRDAIDAAIPPDQQQIMQAMKMRAILGYALVAGSQPVGLLLIAYREPQLFTPAETQMLQALAGQIAVSLRNQQLVHEQMLARQHLDEINRRLTGQTWQQYLSVLGGAIRTIDVGPGMPAEADASPLPTALSAPVVIHGQEIGMLRLEDAAPDREWTPNERALIQAVAGEVAIAVENARLIEQTERRAQREHIVAEISNEMFAANDIESILRTAGDELGSVLRLSRVAVRLGKSHARVGDRYEPHAT